MASLFPCKAHDHHVCIKNALDDAVSLCRKRGVRLTVIRRQVLEIVWQQHKPSGAYHILDCLRTAGVKAEPPTVYRALEFLIANGLVHRIQSLNAFMGCCNPREEHDGVFLICRSCGVAGEIPSVAVNNVIASVADSNSFSLSSVSLEAVGECPECQENHWPDGYDTSIGGSA